MVHVSQGLFFTWLEWPQDDKIIATSQDLTWPISPKRWFSKGNGTPYFLFQGNPGWWNIIIWPDQCLNVWEWFLYYPLVHSRNNIFFGIEETQVSIFSTILLKFTRIPLPHRYFSLNFWTRHGPQRKCLASPTLPRAPPSKTTHPFPPRKSQAFISRHS